MGVLILAWKSHFVAEGHFNEYEAIAERYPEELAKATYPPLTYWTIGRLSLRRFGRALRTGLDPLSLND